MTDDQFVECIQRLDAVLKVAHALRDDLAPYVDDPQHFHPELGHRLRDDLRAVDRHSAQALTWLRKQREMYRGDQSS